MLDLKRLLQSFEEIIGWPYQSPGSNDQNGIDCSGAFVRAYRAQGASIYHGSNRIIRVHCRDVIRVTSASQLRPGMAVFKRRDDGAEPAEYKPGGKNYVPTLVGNFYHIGLVCGTNPLRIIHATTPVAKVDTALGTWSWAGWLKDVKYEEGGDSMPGNETAAQMEVFAPSGNTVNMRSMPNDSAVVLKKVPIGSAVQSKGQQGEWTQITYNGVSGWMQSQFLRAPSSPAIPNPGDTGDMVQVPRALLENIMQSNTAIADSVRALLGVG